MFAAPIADTGLKGHVAKVMLVITGIPVMHRLQIQSPLLAAPSQSKVASRQPVVWHWDRSHRDPAAIF